jgi:two-component system sensor histidine kinase DegS
MLGTDFLELSNGRDDEPLVRIQLSMRNSSSTAKDHSNLSPEELLQEERRRIGEELHSRAAQTLSHALFLLNLYEQEGKSEDLEGARQAIKIAVTEIRHAIHELRNEEPWPLIPVIRDSINDFKERAQIPVRFLTEGEDSEVPREVRNFVQLFIQEGLHNILKHAQATFCEVSLKIQKYALSASIKDNGTGMILTEKTNNSPHFGLKFIKERAEQMGGELIIESENGRGTMLKVMVPCKS